jgi:hypothetical protein
VTKVLVLLLALAAPAYAQQPGSEVRVPEKLEVAVGASAALPIAIAVDRGLTVSKDGPVIVDVTADAGVTIKKRRLLRADAVDPEADAPRFEVTVRGETAGEVVVKLRVRFWLCGGKSCRPVDLRRQTTVAVTAPP